MSLVFVSSFIWTMKFLTNAAAIQATRHARRVYVGGLSPTANEQVIESHFICLYIEILCEKGRSLLFLAF